MTAEAPILAKLRAIPDAKLSDHGWSKARCPAHEDESPSFQWKVADDGSVGLDCRVGCRHEDIVAALGCEMRDLYPPKPKARKPHVVRTVEHEIRDVAGTILAIHERPYLSDGSKGEMMWKQPGKSEYGLNGTPVAGLPLYGSHRDLRPSVILVEGEKCAEALWEVGASALATYGISHKPDAAVLELLRGRTVTLWPDNDEVGKKHMRDIAKRLHGIAADVTWLEPPDDAPKGWDAADLLILADDKRQALADVWTRVGPVPGTSTLATYLACVRDYLTRYVAFSSEHEPTAISLWVAHCYLVEELDVSPILAITSAEMRSGKSRVLDCLEMLVPNRRMVLPSEAVFYTVLARRPRVTVLLDELDVIFGKRMPEKYEGIRGVLNSGNRRGSPVLRVGWEGRKRIEEEFDVFGPKAIAGIGDPPATVLDRSVVIRMKRRAPSEPIARFRDRRARAEATAITQPDWDAVTLVTDVSEVPDGLSDRAMDSWEPLLAIADAAGWSARARAAAMALSGGEDDHVSLGMTLLRDAYDVMRRLHHIPTTKLLEELHSLEDSPWADFYGKPLSARRLATLLEPYGIGPRHERVDGIDVRGYFSQDFEDAWKRYVTPTGTPVTPVTPVTDDLDPAEMANDDNWADTDEGSTRP